MEVIVQLITDPFEEVMLTVGSVISSVIASDEVLVQPLAAVTFTV